MRLGLHIWTLLTCIFVLPLSPAVDVVHEQNCSLFCSKLPLKKEATELLLPKGTNYRQASMSNSRPDVASTSPWLTPIVWDGTFDLTVIDAIYKQQKITVATTIFAIGKYVMFLKDFLETAEQHFFVGYRVNYYLFTDRPQEVPEIKLGAERHLIIINTDCSNCWQESRLRQMEKIEKLIEERLINEADYIFSLDVDTKFHSHWGAETLSDIIAVIHPGYYGTERSQFPFERRPESQAYIPMDEGDYYYGGAVLGGRVDKVLKLVKTCRIMLDMDRAKNIEAVWQEESHLNKYFLYNKPTKLLSPEYLWQDFKERTPNIRVIRFSQVIKNCACSRSSLKEDNKPEATTELHFPKGTNYRQASTSNDRPDVLATSPWLSPIVWEGTFDLTVIDAIYKHHNITVAATVFAVGKYVKFLKGFLETAEEHFFVGYCVKYYLFTDHPLEKLPKFKLGAQRHLKVIKINSSKRWQDITLRRMERIERLIEERLINETDYIFCLDVDGKFHSHWGAETLSDIIAALHPGYYGTQRSQLPFERRPESHAYIPMDEGDYYYGVAVYGGRPHKVLKLVKTCRIMMDMDRANNIEAVWQEESHLNKYFLYNKPTKLLSPEYLWQDFITPKPNIRVKRFSQVIKNYAEIRPNP